MKTLILLIICVGIYFPKVAALETPRFIQMTEHWTSRAIDAEPKV